MIVDLELYKINKKFIQDWAQLNADKNFNTIISTMALSTGCPCVVVAHWLAELYGYPQELIDKINMLCSFYGYTEIKGKPEGCPI